MSRPYRFAMSILHLLIGAFFRRVEVDGIENVPQSRGGLLVAWHPNGLIDPALILAQLPGRVSFGARHGLFDIPVLGTIMRTLGSVPIYRASDNPGDATDRRRANRTSLDALAERIAAGSFAALFPEGLSHDAPHLMELKTGAARLYYRARQFEAERGGASTPPAIVPVGLYYDHKHAFRSRALVRFHAPLTLPAELDVCPPRDEPQERFLQRARSLTVEIEAALDAAVLPTENWELHHLFHRGRKLVRAERAARAGADLGRPRLLEKQIGFARIWTGYRMLHHTEPVEVAEIMDRVREYDADLTALGIEDHELDRDPRLGSAILPLVVLAQLLMVYILLPPLLLLGVVVNLPAAIICTLVARRMSKASKDEASLKILVGAILFPLSWLAVAFLVALGVVRLNTVFPGLSSVPVVAGLFTAALGAIGGAVALGYRRLSRETLRSLRVRFTRRRRATQIERLRAERSELHDRIVALGEGLDLPGAITRDGSVVSR